MTSPAIRIFPLDVALFRDGRPFDAADAHGARSISWTPPQTTLLGALRHELLTVNDISYQKFRKGACTDTVLGPDPSTLGTLTLGPVLGASQRRNKTELYFPLPADLILIDTKFGYQLPVPEDLGPARSNLPLGLRPLAPFDLLTGALKKTKRDAVITYDLKVRALAGASLHSYLLSKHLLAQPPLEEFAPELHLGIQRDPLKFCAREGRLYTAEFLRLQNSPESTAFYWADILHGGEAFHANRWIRTLGGEARPFAFERTSANPYVTADLKASIESELVKTGWREGALHFRLYVLSPAPPGESGWKPRLPPGLDLEITGAAVNRAIWFSGWDIAGNKPRDARPFIPSGSVYFLKAKSPTSPQETAARIMEAFWYRAALSPDPNDAKSGYGITLVGIYPYAH